MRVLMISKACVVGAYQRKLELIAEHADIELTVAVPPGWRDERGLTPLERAHTRGYALVVEPIAINGSFHLHFYPRLGRLMDRLRPDIVHIDEEPYNLATWHALQLARRRGARVLFFSWQNILRRYPFPFSHFEREVLRESAAAIVGNQESLQVWRAKGFAGPAHVIPQFGVDADFFRPPDPPRRAAGAEFTAGYAGRLVPEKGVDLLLEAAAQLPAPPRLRLLGSGPERGRLGQLARSLGIAQRVTFELPVPSMQMPGFFAGLDCLVLPSRTRPNWKEQFGRVLVEAMACSVPVVGSASGELPNVIGQAGLTFPEGDPAALADCLRELSADPGLRARLSAAGRERVLEHYTHQQVAEATARVYRALAAGKL